MPGRIGRRDTTGAIRYLREIVKDWKAVAKAAGLDVAEPELDRIVAPLAGLEETFRPLVEKLSFEMEPATGACEGEETV